VVARGQFDADLVVIGAGAVGLAVAARVAPTRSVVVVEAREVFGLETTSHNTGIVHAGLFYATGSLKHRLCLEGNPLVYEWCAAHDVPVRAPGN
jgi:L-2-hydroxyglutarate oxidase LhgO